MPRPKLILPDFLSADEPVASLEITATIAFKDCDPMGVLWHGRYLDYFEQARHALGHSLGFDIAVLDHAGWYLPIIRSQVLHRRAAQPLQEVRVQAALYPSAQARLYHRYHMRDDVGLLAEGETEQVIVDRHFELRLTLPELLAAIVDPRP